MSKERSRPWQDPTLLIGFEPDWLGQFDTHEDWVRHATRALTDHTGSLGEEVRPICVDARGRRCNIGKDFARARDEGAFPVRYFVGGRIVPFDAMADAARDLAELTSYAEIVGWISGNRAPIRAACDRVQELVRERIRIRDREEDFEAGERPTSPSEDNQAGEHPASLSERAQVGKPPDWTDPTTLVSVPLGVLDAAARALVAAGFLDYPHAPPSSLPEVLGQCGAAGAGLVDAMIEAGVPGADDRAGDALA